MSKDLAGLDAVASAELVARGDVSAREMVEAGIRRVEAVNGQIHAVIHPRFDKALDEVDAGNADRRFHGVPIVVKDLDGTLAGEPWHGGMRVLKDLGWTEKQDSTLFRLLKESGFVIIGKANTPELGTMTTTEPLAHGPTRNPFNLGHSTGGSSGGSAAAVASRMVPVAHAGDGGGSIRVPASECNLVGLKPSRGRVSLGPVEGEGWAGCVSRHVVTRTVRDSAAVLDILGRPMSGDPYGPMQPAPAGGYEKAMLQLPKGLKVGVMLRTPANEFAVHEDVRQATLQCTSMLETMGYAIEEAHPAALDNDIMMTNIAVIIRTNVAAALEVWGERIGRPIVESDIEPINWEYYKLGKAMSSVQYVRALDAMHLWSRDVESWWEDFDLLVTPTVCEPPPALGAYRTTDDPWAPFHKNKVITTFVRPFNVTGQPAISLPIGMSSSGLPIGVQIVAAEGREDQLLAIAAVLEQSLRWDQRLPLVHAR
ncbi:MAG TPA: amidase [Burkholderiaceae bacterium]|jgi:amidase